MELRPERCPGSQPPHGGGDGADSFSALPDDVLLQVLLRLRCTRAATRASVLSRRWRGLWAHLPELCFRDVGPDAALAQVALARSVLSLLGVHIPEHHLLDAARVTSLLRAAARLAPAEFAFAVRGRRQGCGITVELPCFDRASSIKLEMRSLMLATPAPADEFRALETCPSPAASSTPSPCSPSARTCACSRWATAGASARSRSTRRRWRSLSG